MRHETFSTRDNAGGFFFAEKFTKIDEKAHFFKLRNLLKLFFIYSRSQVFEKLCQWEEH